MADFVIMKSYTCSLVGSWKTQPLGFYYVVRFEVSIYLVRFVQVGCSPWVLASCVSHRIKLSFNGKVALVF